MRKIFFLIILLLFQQGCNSVKPDKLIGIWLCKKGPAEVVLTLNQDGTYSRSISGENKISVKPDAQKGFDVVGFNDFQLVKNFGNWTLNKDKITFPSDGKVNYCFTVKVKNSDTLKFVMGTRAEVVDREYIFKRFTKIPAGN